MTTHSIEHSETLRSAGNLVSYSRWIASLNKARTTGWRWRDELDIKTINISGKIYIHVDEIARFEARALAGEFAKEIHSPNSRKAA